MTDNSTRTICQGSDLHAQRRTGCRRTVQQQMFTGGQVGRQHHAVDGIPDIMRTVSNLPTVYSPEAVGKAPGTYMLKVPENECLEHSMKGWPMCGGQ